MSSIGLHYVNCTQFKIKLLNHLGNKLQSIYKSKADCIRNFSRVEIIKLMKEIKEPSYIYNFEPYNFVAVFSLVKRSYYSR